MKRLQPMSWFMIFASILIALVIISVDKAPYKKHSCRWDKCPYKGVTPNTASKAVVSYTGELMTYAYFIDMLHLQYPTEEYEQLEERLLNSK